MKVAVTKIDTSFSNGTTQMFATSNFDPYAGSRASIQAIPGIQAILGILLFALK